MNPQQESHSWQLHHHEQLFLHTSSGAPSIRLKFFHYPAYRQTVQLIQPPADCKLKEKGNNRYFLFQQRVHSKQMISLERIINVFPVPSSLPLHDNWGAISNIPRLLQRKYKQSFTYWPVSSTAIRAVADEHWFETDDLSDWVLDTSRYIIGKIRYPEKQEKRLGADQER
jgi:hypothetical protein